MNLDNQQESGNIEDRRGSQPGRFVVGGGIGTIILAAVIFFMGGDPSAILDQNTAQNSYEYSNSNNETLNDEGGKFVSKILGSTEKVWSQKFTEMGRNYIPPTLVLFSDRTMSQCGGAGMATGPFYCPADKKVYLDTNFFAVMQQEMGVNGNFGYAYVIAHEVGHYVQDLMGISSKIHQLQNQSSEKEANRLSVMLELQADFFAGYWAHYAKNDIQLSSQDIIAAVEAANAVGDDKLQSQSQGFVVPDSFTHGTSAQRIEWFKRGFETGDLSRSNTFQELSNGSY